MFFRVVMVSRSWSKTISVSDDTHQRLSIRKVSGGHRTLDAAIRELLDFKQYTEIMNSTGQSPKDGGV